jgi:hypothetical protein
MRVVDGGALPHRNGSICRLERIRSWVPDRYTIESPDILRLDGSPSLPKDIVGEHPVQPDGTISLGSYGRVFVAGLTAGQATSVLQGHLAKKLDRPAIWVRVTTFKSKFCTVIVSKDGQERQRVRFPLTTDYETVLPRHVIRSK